jgi:hypothetical protein
LATPGLLLTELFIFSAACFVMAVISVATHVVSSRKIIGWHSERSSN